MKEKMIYVLTDLPGLKNIPIIKSEPQLIKENSSVNQYGK